MNQPIIDKASAIMAQRTGALSYCSLALIDAEGFPTVSTISASKTEGIAWVTFCTGIGSNKVSRIQKNNRASVCFNGADYNITLVGTVAIVTDLETKKAMWYEGLENHFKGPEDPNFCILTFKTSRYNLFVDWEEAQGVL